eukprot:142526_1
MGTYWVMRAIEDHNKLSQIKCISLISGGSWGFILWLYEEKPGSTDHAILKWMLNHDMASWGTKGPFEKGWPFQESWWIRWVSEIEKNIVKMTTLDSTTNFDHTFRAKLKERGLESATVYFVVESVGTNLHSIKIGGKKRTFTNRIWGLADFNDYCWFKSSLTVTDAVVVAGETFSCSKVIPGCPANGCPMSSLSIHRKYEESGLVRILEVLAFCSSAWATQAAHVSMTRHTTPIITITIPEIPEKVQTFRLIDAGGTFNNPLVPLMIDDAYLLTKKVKIWNWDFSHQKNNVKEISHLNEVMKQIGKPIEDFVWRKSTGHNRAQVFKIEGRLIYHCPLFGKWSKNKMMKEFPTMGGYTGILVKRWSMMRYLYFKEDWFGNVDGEDGLISAM